MPVDRSPEGIRSIVSQCEAADVPVYVGQLGTEGAKQYGTHRSDAKRGDSQFWAEDLRESESFLVCEERFLFEVKK